MRRMLVDRQPGTPQPPGNPPDLPDPDGPVPVEEPPVPSAPPPIDPPPPPVQVWRRAEPMASIPQRALGDSAPTACRSLR